MNYDAINERFEAEWKKDIEDVSQRQLLRSIYNCGTEESNSVIRKGWVIEEYFKKIGGYWSTRLKTRDGVVKYRPAEDAWCGIFIAAILLDFNLNWKIAHYILPSTSRLASDDKWLKETGYPRPVVDGPIKKGDIVTIRTKRVGTKSYGDHVVWAASDEDSEGYFQTYEGNATGPGPASKKDRQGVIKTRRSKKVVCNIYRLDERHYRQ